MPTYMMLAKWTEAGVKTINDVPERLERFRNIVKSVGGEVKAYYFVFGKYDIVAIVEAPSDEAAGKVALTNTKFGMVSIETWKAFSEAEGLEVIKGLP
ncbi:MAG: GYD domain-containing protein [Halobacteriota archaeon]